MKDLKIRKSRDRAIAVYSRLHEGESSTATYTYTQRGIANDTNGGLLGEGTKADRT
jgi:hypothetical protein